MLNMLFVKEPLYPCLEGIWKILSIHTIFFIVIIIKHFFYNNFESSAACVIFFLFANGPQHSNKAEWNNDAYI